MIFSRKSAATRALHEWMACHEKLVKGRYRSDFREWTEQLPDILALQPDVECRFKGQRPLAWCMTALPYSRALLDAILGLPPGHPGGPDPGMTIQDVINASRKAEHNEHVARALSAVVAWAHPRQFPSPSHAGNANLMSDLVRLHPEIDPVVLEKLRMSGYSPDAAGTRGKTVLHSMVANRANHRAITWACQHCNLEAVDGEGRTALAIAISLGARSCVAALLEAGANHSHGSVASIIKTSSYASFGQSPAFVAIEQMIQARATAGALQAETPAPASPQPVRAPRF